MGMGRFWVILPLVALSMSGCGWVEVPAPPGMGPASRTAAPVVRSGPVVRTPPAVRTATRPPVLPPVSAARVAPVSSAPLSPKPVTTSPIASQPAAVTPITQARRPASPSKASAPAPARLAVTPTIVAAKTPVSPARPRPPAPSARNAATDKSLFVGSNVILVRPGDTVYAISRRHEVSVRSLVQVNGLRPPYRLAIGQRLALPEEKRHVVARGETLYRISRAYGVDIQALALANGISAPYGIHVGQQLWVPAAVGDSARTILANAPAGSRAAEPASGRATAPSAASPAPRSAVAQKPTAKPAMRLAVGPAPKRPAVTTRPSLPKPSAAIVIPKPPARSKAGFVWPVEGKIILGFGPKTKGLQNDGVNIAAPKGTPIRAADNGVVAYVGNEVRGFGNLLLVKHAKGWVTAYAHTDEILVKVGERVKRGQVVARVGNSGGVSRPQLHFELRRGRQPVDPRRYIKRGGVA